MGFGMSLTGPWNDQAAFDVTVSWIAVGNNTITTPAKWAPRG